MPFDKNKLQKRKNSANISFFIIFKALKHFYLHSHDLDRSNFNNILSESWGSSRMSVIRNLDLKVLLIFLRTWLVITVLVKVLSLFQNEWNVTVEVRYLGIFTILSNVNNVQSSV